MRSAFGLLLASCLAPWCTASNGRIGSIQMSNPVQVRFEQFSIQIGPTNNARPLGQRDADYILGIAEDLIYNYFRDHFDSFALDGTTTILDGSNDPDVRETLEFKYAMIGTVSIPVDPAAGRAQTTTISFSSGVAYFEGNPDVKGPSAAEVQALVSLALNEADLLGALRSQYPYITEATYFRGSDAAPQSSDPEMDESTDEELKSSQLMDSPLDVSGENDSKDQFIIIVGSACGAAVMFSLLLAVGFVAKQKQRSSFWREDNHRNSVDGKEVAIDMDAALEDISLECGNTRSPSKRRTIRDAKQQSLHQRDSLRETAAQEDALSDTGSNRLGRLLNSAAAVASALPPLCTKPSQSEDGEFEKASKGDSNVHESADPDTSSCSNDSSHSNESNKDFNNCLSDFEGNAVVKPNLIPVTDVERFNDDDPRNPLPQSQIDTAPEHDDTLTTIDLSDASSPSPNRTKAKQEGFLAKYVQPITGTFLPLSAAGLTYFGHGNNTEDDDHNGNTPDCETPNRKKKQSLTPQTATTAGDHWSDVSSDYRTDDFEMDRAWDPDDASIGSGMGNDVFSPRPSYNDEERLLDSLAGHADRYNLGKLRTPPSKQTPEMDRRFHNVLDTAEV